MNAKLQRKVGNLLRKSSSYWKLTGANSIQFDNSQSGLVYANKLAALMAKAGESVDIQAVDAPIRFPKGSGKTFDPLGHYSEERLQDRQDVSRSDD